MSKRFIQIGLCVILVMTLSVVAFAADGEFTRDITVRGITVTVGDKTIENVYSDPVDYWEETAAGSLMDYKIIYETVNDTDAVIYTAYYPDTTTGRVGNVTEYTCEIQNGSYVVTKINTSGDGKTYIPVGGIVISLSNAKNANFAKVGDVVTLGGSKISVPTKAIESAAGKRVVVDSTNANRSMPMVVYYDYQFGAKTGTNIYGTEVLCQYNFEDNTFIVIGFRDFLEGDDSGSPIPDNGFVISAYGEGYRQLLAEGELFNVGDKVKMAGFDFVRFGGTIKGKYDYVNPSRETNPGAMETATEEFAAFRGTNQTIIYKYGWTYKNAAGTGTNVYGYEAAVDANGVIVEIGVNVSKIPEGGYVISGHGTGRDFIRSNAVLGATVVLDEVNQTYAISTTLNSYYENLVLGVEKDIQTAEKRIQQLYDVNAELLEKMIADVKQELGDLKTVKEEIETALENPDLTEAARLSLLMRYNNSQLVIEKLRQKIIISSADSKAVSARAVWHRPIEKTYAEIENNIKMYREIGMNLIFVETLYNGFSAFRSECAEFPYHKELSASYAKDDNTVYNDYLSAFLACCKEYGIEVHAWVENFYVGLSDKAEILKLHPDWVMYNDDNTTVQRNEGGPYYFIDPANMEVQDLLISYYNELFEKHPDVAGLNLDYIRYPVSSDTEDTGFTMAAMKGFYESLGKTFSENQLSDRTKMANKFMQLFDENYLAGGKDEAVANYQKWVNYRMGVITEYVRRIKNEVKLPNDIMLSTSVFASLQESTQAKKQDWQRWFNNGWIDIATPMAYYTNTVDVNQKVQEMILMGGNNCMYYTGIASSYSGLPAWQNKEFVEASYNAGASGYVIFCSTQIVGHEDVQQALSSGVNSKWAVLPHAAIKDVLAASFADILDKADRIYIPAEGMTAENKDALAAIFDEIAAMADTSAENIYNLAKRIETLASKEVKNYAKGYARQRIIEQLGELADILDARVSMQMIADNEWDPEETPERPSFEEEPVTPDVPSEPDTPDNGENEPELNFFQRIWKAIVDFFKMLFGIKD
ncbi:MAG: hypothetical protein E7461_02250 [Ruminococcaceae bacterium]|nr:hypothetical protein [Oscillospiraceae bacterium]